MPQIFLNFVKSYLPLKSESVCTSGSCMTPADLKHRGEITRTFLTPSTVESSKQTKNVFQLLHIRQEVKKASIPAWQDITT